MNVHIRPQTRCDRDAKPLILCMNKLNSSVSFNTFSAPVICFKYLMLTRCELTLLTAVRSFLDFLVCLLNESSLVEGCWFPCSFTANCTVTKKSGSPLWVWGTKPPTVSYFLISKNLGVDYPSLVLLLEGLAFAQGHHTWSKQGVCTIASNTTDR